jgi:hypothetical protein
MVQQGANTYWQDPNWFSPIYKQLRSGGYEAMLSDLLGLRSRGLARDIVRTDALAAQQEQSLSPFDARWLELLQTAVLTGASDSAPGCAVSYRYKKEIEESIGFGAKHKRIVYLDGLYDQARRCQIVRRRIIQTDEANRRAGCGKFARPVQRSYPNRDVSECSVNTF